MTGDSKPFGLHDVKLTDIAGLNQADLPSSQLLTYTPRLAGGELMGDDQIKSVASFIIGADWTLESGGISLAALAIMTGQPVTVAGTSPQETATFSLAGGARMPYFRIYGQALGEGNDDFHVKLFKCKLTGNLEGNFAGESFLVTKCSGVAVPDPDNENKIEEWVANETATNLPTN